MSNEELNETLGIAIIGMAVRFPGAGSIDKFWRNVREGVESITFFSDEELRHVDPSVLNDPNFVKAGALLEGVEMFDASFFDLSAMEAEITDPQHRIFLEAAHEALESAGYDPEKYEGSIGVYAGAGMNTYLMFNLAPHAELVRSVGALPLVIGNDKDYLVTRVSYKLNLGGPSVSVQTACSTSLVAVSVACQSLLDYQCDMALAGGVSLRIPQKIGYRYQEGSINSPDGHCRAFDATAQGTVFGDGLGIVVLKRLGDALADGDNIYAAIKGFAVNNDGALKIGFTAPSVDGQARVISEALSASGVEPETIGYVEAHGTGTPLGDPIEIAALKKAFGNDLKRKNFCAIGSVKTNVGHLDTAAGVAGLIKTTLALKHKLLPPTLHFERPNPQINFDESPFYVNTQLRQWENGSAPRRAGVSSFGIGGTNAHVVLEEAPLQEASGPSRPFQLLLLSAKSASALEAATDNLARFLREHPDVNLADVAFTLQLGRKRFSHRRAVVCRDLDTAVSSLETRDPARVLTHAADAGERPIVFMFSGQGSQHVNMGLDLYRSEPTFRLNVDRCSELLRPLLGIDLREVIYPADERLADAAQQLEQTFITQPALFVTEYALAALWMEWGVKPRAMIGHSIGEYTAACLSGVFSLEQGLALVATRGRMMQSLPVGAMLAVSLSSAEVEPLLGRHLSVAVINSPSLCVVSGPADAVDELAERLGRRNINCRCLHTSHAFHSSMMEPIVAEFAWQVSKVNLKAPAIPYISNLTGTWIRADEATDPQYWAQHLRQTVRFGDGLLRLTGSAKNILLEIGPGQTLSALAKAQTSEQVSLSSMHRPDDTASDAEQLLSRLGQIWLAGGKIDWSGFYTNEKRRRLSLPTYPFERQRYWIDPPKITLSTADHRTPDANRGVLAADSSAANDAATPPGSSSAIEQLDAHRSAHQRPLMGTPYVAPRNETEQKIAHIWETFLSVKDVGVDDNFFELGGHSLLATQLIGLVRDAFSLPLPLGALFRSPTVSGLARELSTLRRDASPSPASSAAFDTLPRITPDFEHRHDPFPLTDIQQAYWVGRSSSLELGGVATHIYFEMEARGLDVGRLEMALRRVISRHDMLRAVISADGRQRVLEEVPPYEIALLDLSEMGEAEAEAALSGVRGRMSHQVLDAGHWPLFEVRASQLRGGRLRLHVSFDMLIGDAWSFRLLWRDLLTYYQDEAAELGPLNLTFRDYVLAQERLRQTALYEEAQRYWWARLDALPPAPELPLARKPLEVGRPRFVRRRGRMDAERWEELKRRGGRAGMTASGVLLAAYAEVLSLWSRRQHFTINLTLFNRLSLHEDVERVVGDFTSLTLLEADYRGSGGYVGRGRRLQEQLWEDIDRRYVSGVEVMRELARKRGAAQAAMPVVFTSELNFTTSNDEASRQEVASEKTGDDGKLEHIYGISQTPQVWLDLQVSEVNGDLVFNWDGVEELFPDGLVQQMFDAFTLLIDRLATGDDAWDDACPLSLTPEQAERRTAFNSTDTPIPDSLLHRPFLEQATRAPEAPALISNRLGLSYGELERLTRRLALRLRREGTHPNSLVAVVMEKGWEQVAAVLAVLRAGAAYLPVSADLPSERLCHLLRHGEVAVALTQPWVEGRVEWPEGVTRISVVVDEEDEDGEGEAGVETDAARAEPDLDAVQRPSDLAYVIYTSGSTGQPKGVMIDHRGALNTVLDVNARFGLSPADRVLGLSSLSFDLSVYDIFGTLGAGAALVIPDHGTAGPDPRHWGEMVERHGVTVWNSVPALMQLMTEYEAARGSGALRGLKLVMLSGDWIGLELPGEVTRYAPAARVVSLGGATEASIWSILYEVEGVEAGWRSIPYGHPMNNQRVYVLNERMEECPEWVSGELYIGGVGVARGYWRDEARTGRSFVEWGGERVYRTGDVGRQLGCGEIEFLGREDAQVKVQGHRIELGEIEAALHGHEGVRGCAVKAVGERLGAKSLVAYIVTESAGAPDADELRGFLREKLPGYMVPSTFIFLDALPLNSNGKVNRGALPAPEHFALQDGRDLLLPRSPLEEMVANIWAELLGVPRVGLDDNFFELGGQSVTATRMLARVRNTFDVEMPLRALFDGPALGEFAAALEDALRSGQRLHAPPIRPVPRDGHLSLSFAQQRLWFLDRLQPESAVYNLSAALRLNGPLDVAALEESLREIIRRHESLRTTFKEVEGRPLQVISPPRFSLDAVDLRGLEAAEREARARQLAAEEAQRPFDLARGPLLRVRLLKLNEDEYVALFTMHHIIGDGWSIGVLMRELTALYEAFDKGRLSPLGELPIQYADFAVWQRGWLQGEVLDKQLAYWRQQLAGELAALALPTDRPHPPVRTYCGGLRSFTLSLEASEKLKGLSRREGVTLYMTLLAGLKTLLYRYSGQEDVIIGTPIANRSLKELENIIGLFVNTLVLRTDLSGDPTFTELLARVREVTLGAYAHQDVPFEKLVEELQPERNLSGSPFFNVMFAFQNAPEAALHFRDLKLSPFRAETETAKFDLNFNMVETPGGLRGLVTYQTDLFDDSTIERLLSHFVTLLEAAAATPGAKLSDLPMASDAEHRRLLVELNDTDRDFPGGRCLHELFEEQAARTPEAVALVFEGERLSYAELNRRANQLAHHLRALGARPETLVGLCVERSPDLIVGLLGILKAGGAYVPLDPASPKERLAVMLEVSRPPLLLTHGVLSERLPDGVTSVVLLDEDWPAIARASGQNPSPLATPENSAYVIFTSGSTGEPKGVVIEQRQILNYYHAIVERLSLSPGMGFAMVQPLTFDSSQTMLFPALCTGGTLHLIPRELAADPTALNGYFARHSIDALKISPSHLAALQDSDHPEHLLPRRCLVLGGEASRWDWVEGLQRLAPECVIFNHYGPTEATVGMLTFKHDAAATDCPPGNVPLGRPLANTRAYVLDSRLQPVATTVQGELYIGGAGVARGYLGDPAKTAERFIPDPFSAELGARLYKTGDTVRHLADGNLLFIGRTDSQVKVRGFRVELGEIEGVLRRHASVKEAVLVAREDERRGTVLFAYAVAHPEPEGEVQPRLAERLKEYLQERLPEYMVPAAVTLLDALPLSAHGKISLKALPTPELAEAEATGGFVAPRDEVESRLSQIWQEVLGLDSVSVTASFFDLGGHSLLATQAVSRINRAFRFELPLRRIFESPTIAGLARHVEQALREGRQSKLPPLCRVERDGNSLPLSFAQQRLWFLDQLEPESTAYNRPAAIRLVGRLDIAALEQALNEIIRRHETLRSTFAVVDGDIVQVLHPPRKLAVSVIDLEELDEGERESQLREMIAELSRERFDLSRWPLLKVKLARLGDEEHVVLLVMHHIITDYWSLEVFVRETAALYEAFRNDLPSPLEELVIQYADFAHWQRQWLQGEALQEQLSYWRKALAAAPPSLHLPTDRPRQGLRSWRGMVAPFHLPSPLSDRLRAMSREEDVTLFMLLLAAFQVLLYGYTGQENVVVGTTIANRKYREVEKLIGFFINTLALCTDLSGNPSFRELLARVREVTLGAYDHQDLPFEKILEEVQRERHAEERLTLGVFFQLLNAPQSSQELPGLTVERLDIESDTSKLELNFSLMESAEGGGIGGRLEYSTDLFDAMTIDRMMTGYRTLLEAVAENPDADLEALAGLVEGDALMLDDFNADIEAG